MSSLLRLERQRKVFLKSISNSHMSLSFLLKSHKNHILWGGTYVRLLIRIWLMQGSTPPTRDTALKGRKTFHLLRCRSIKDGCIAKNRGENRHKTVSIVTWLALLGENTPPVCWAKDGWFKPHLDQHSWRIFKRKSKHPCRRDPWILQNY